MPSWKNHDPEVIVKKCKDHSDQRLSYHTGYLVFWGGRSDHESNQKKKGHSNPEPIA
ncbi:hypothetical protein FD42_GL001383 [Lentilactobacillus hilgardii DSM 20176 = ATCC 8290]|nr:hypothetical protein FD42_GL001383 [Lentilactobacillus hilgardii DSM 20176 = ATCC 8290]